MNAAKEFSFNLTVSCELQICWFNKYLLNNWIYGGEQDKLQTLYQILIVLITFDLTFIILLYSSRP